MDSTTYDIVRKHINDLSKKIESSLQKSSAVGRQWKVKILPSYDNVIGGYNFQIEALSWNGNMTVVDGFEIRNAIRVLKEFDEIANSKIRLSRAYRQKVVTVLSVGLKKSLFEKQQGTLTKPQAELKAEFDKGRRMRVVNAHYRSGGEYRFTDNNELVRYRTFHNLMTALYGWQKPYPKNNYFESKEDKQWNSTQLESVNTSSS